MFFPQFFLGLDGMTRRMQTYADNLGWNGLNLVSTIGAFLMGLGFFVLVVNLLYSAWKNKRDTANDPGMVVHLSGGLNHQFKLTTL